MVKAEAAKEMLRSPAKRAKAETALHLLHAVVAGTNGAHIGLAAADVTGIQVCSCACPPTQVSASDFADSLRRDIHHAESLGRTAQARCTVLLSSRQVTEAEARGQVVMGVLGSAGL